LGRQRGEREVNKVALIIAGIVFLIGGIATPVASGGLDFIQVSVLLFIWAEVQK
jgi:hypothetical protein